MSKENSKQPFTMVPHVCFDKYMQEMTPSEFQTYMFIMRKTKGWHKPSDEISLSQFEKYTNSSIPTIRKALKGLREKGFVKRTSAGISYRYSIIKPELNFKKGKKERINGERNLQGKVKDSFTEPCKNLSTQKKELNIKLNTTNSKKSKIRIEVPEFEVGKVINEWNQLFNVNIDPNDQPWYKLIKEVLHYFTSDDLKSAMQNRLDDDYYQDKYSLLHNPKSFFPYLQTIENDLHRNPVKIYTYEEKNSMVTGPKKYNDQDFTIRKDLRDKEDKPKWEYKPKAHV